MPRQTVPPQLPVHSQSPIRSQFNLPAAQALHLPKSQNFVVSPQPPVLVHSRKQGLVPSQAVGLARWTGRTAVAGAVHRVAAADAILRGRAARWWCGTSAAVAAGVALAAVAAAGRHIPVAVEPAGGAGAGQIGAADRVGATSRLAGGWCAIRRWRRSGIVGASPQEDAEGGPAEHMDFHGSSVPRGTTISNMGEPSHQHTEGCCTCRRRH